MKTGSFVSRGWVRWALAAGCTLTGLLLFVVAFGMTLEEPDPPSDDLMALWAAAELVAVTVSVPLLLRLLARRSLGAGVVLALLAPLSASTPAAAVAVVLLVSLRAWPPAVAAAGAFAVSTATVVLLTERDALLLLVSLAVVLVVLVLVGVVLGARRALAEQQGREHALVVDAARAEERARIAGEMHDTLSHHLGLIALHAGALGRRDDLPPQTVRSSSRLVADLSRTAHAELREVLGVLHQGPQPTVPPLLAADVPGVVEQHRTAGAAVEASLDPAVVSVPPDPRLSEATSRLLARAVRELLANAARHAPGSPVALAVAAEDSGVVLTCRNRVVVPEPATAGPGLGLEGLAERVRLRGGTCEAEVADDHFAVRLAVPW